MAQKKSSTRKYSASASEQVATELHEMKKGTLHSGRSSKRVTNPKQAIAIALSEARRAGKKVPPPPKKAAAKKAPAKKVPAKKSPAKKKPPATASRKNSKP